MPKRRKLPAHERARRSEQLKNGILPADPRMPVPNNGRAGEKHQKPKKEDYGRLGSKCHAEKEMAARKENRNAKKKKTRYLPQGKQMRLNKTRANTTRLMQKPAHALPPSFHLSQGPPGLR